MDGRDKAKMNMKIMNKRNIRLLYLLLYMVAALTIALNQPMNDTYPSLCNPPDEHARYRVPLYICEHGTLPTGFEEELFSGECRWTYGFYTLLPYMIQGFAMRFVDMFTDSALALLYTARFVNVIFGLLTACMTLLIGNKLFQNSRIKWLFCFLVTFLPQSLFLHTYVNPDSLCMLSVALMIYGMICGLREGFDLKPSLFLTVGIILCALSYYNAYGYIICSIFIFIVSFLYKENGWKFNWKPFLLKGSIIAVIVLLCIGWSFVRNYLLYDGDFIGLDTKENFVKSFGIVRESFESQGKSLLSMLAGTTFIPKTIISFIAVYGSNTIYTWWGVYIFYLFIFAAGIAGMIFCREKKPDMPLKKEQKAKNRKRIVFQCSMLFCILVPLFLTIRYSYSVDYQPQGRYMMPALIPLIYFVCHGLEKLPFFTKMSEKRKEILYLFFIGGIVLSLFIMIFVTALPVYLENPVL